MGGVGDYLVTSSISEETIGEGTEYVMDGDTLTLEFDTDSIDSWENGTNVFAVRVVLTYSEDETSQGIGCVGGAAQPDPDTITGTVVHNEHNGTGSGQNQDQGSSSHEFVVQWSMAVLNGTVLSGLSESEIHDQFDARGAGLGAYSLDITVDVEAGGGFQCTHTDDGEEVQYLVEVLILDYTVEPAS